MLDEHARLHDLIGHIHTTATDERAQLRLGTIAPHKLTKQYTQHHADGEQQGKYDSVFRVLIHEKYYINLNEQQQSAYHSGRGSRCGRFSGAATCS